MLPSRGQAQAHDERVEDDWKAPKLAGPKAWLNAMD
jgi:hypothetical protein